MTNLIRLSQCRWLVWVFPFPIVHLTVAVKRIGRRCLKFNQWGFECYAGSGWVSEWSVASVHCVAKWGVSRGTRSRETRSLEAASSSATRHAGAGSGGAGREETPAEICQFLSSKGCFATSWVGLFLPAGAEEKVRVDGVCWGILTNITECQ